MQGLLNAGDLGPGQCDVDGGSAEAQAEAELVLPTNVGPRDEPNSERKTRRDARSGNTDPNRPCMELWQPANESRVQHSG